MQVSHTEPGLARLSPKSWTRTTWAFVLSAAVVVVSSLLYALVGDSIVASAYRGESFDFLNRRLAAHRMSRPWGSLEHYQMLGRLLLSRILLVFVCTFLVVLAIVRRCDLRRGLNRFFGAATHPLNLAVFRIVVFYTIFHAVDVPLVASFAGLPTALMAPPLGLGWFFEHFAPGVALATILARLLLVFSFLAMIGLFSRTSALLSFVLGLYVLGLPNFFGKIDHNHHHLVWFAAVLATSRCGAALSCDAIIAAWRGAEHGDAAPPGASREFGLPLRIAMVLMGQAYFFPGFWKLWESGGHWFLTDNLKFIMYQKWFEMGGYTPLFRVDQYSLLCKIGAFATIVFEVSIIFLIFSRRLRPLIPAGGVFFHGMTEVFMGISFRELLRCHVVFWDWHAIARRAGSWLYKDEACVLYDGRRRAWRRYVAVVRVFDIFGRVRYLNVTGGQEAAVAPSFAILAARIPLFWPALPFFQLPPVAAWARRLRAHSPQPPPPVRGTWRTGPAAALTHLRLRTALIAVGLLLVVGNFVASATRHDGWPFTEYPTFAGQAFPESEGVALGVAAADGLPIRPTRPLSAIIPPHRLAGQMSLIVSGLQTGEAAERLVTLGRVWKQNNAGLDRARFIRLYKTTISTIPELARHNPLRQDLLLEEAF